MPQNSTRSPRILLLLAYLYVGLGVFIAGVCLLPVQHQGMVNPSADLDTSNIAYLGYQPGEVGLATGVDAAIYATPAAPAPYDPPAGTGHQEGQTVPSCEGIDWDEVDPVDLNHDGYIDCGSDLELGA